MALSLADFADQFQTPMMQGLVQIITNTSVFLKYLKFIQVDGLAYRYNREQTLGGIAFRPLNGNYSVSAADVGIINPEVETLAIFGGQVQSDRILVNLQGDKLRASRIAAKVKKASLFFDRYCIQGDPGTNPNSFTGLNARLTGKQVIIAGDGKTSDISNMTPGPITIDAFVSMQDAVVGVDNSKKTMVMNKQARRWLSNHVRAEARGMGVYDAAGTQIQSFNGSPVEVIDEDGDEQPILAFNETFGGSNITASAYCIKFGDDVDETDMQGLIGSKLIEQIPVGLLGTYYLDLIESLMGIAIFHPRAAARLQGILPG